MMNRKLEQLLSFGLILSVTACCFLTGGVTNGDAARPVSGDTQTDATAPAAPTPAAVSGTPRSHGGEEGREETVYVIADASGAPTRQISSVWLKNPDEAATITDRADLEDIQNTKGDETYTVDEAGDLVWAANGNDIYYQGDSGETPPISVHIAYALDGKPVSPETLAGASGHLVMTFTYENDTRTFKIVDEEPAAMYQPFAVISCAVLDSAKAANVQVTNGRIINLGEQMVVAGLALPGLRESLGLDDIEGPDGEQLGVDIPETVTVSADVTDFSLLTTLTIAENSLLNEIDLDDVNSFDELEDAIDELTDASTQLVDGSGQLQDGTTALAEGAGTLSAGVDELSSGADAIASNMGTLSSGLNDLESGAYTLASGLDTLGSQVQGLPGATDALYKGAAALKGALENAATGAGDLETGVEALNAGLEPIGRAAQGIQTEAQTIGEFADAVTTYINDCGAQLTAADPGPQLAEASGALDSAIGVNQTAEAALYDLMETADETQQGQLQAVLDTLSSSDTYIASAQGELAAVPTSVPTVAPAQDKETALGYLGQIKALAAGDDSEQKSVLSLATALANGAPALQQGGAKLQEGIEQLSGGLDTMNNSVGGLVDGLGTLSDSSQELVSGVGQLSSGADSLAWGAGNAASGAGQLSAGANTLAGGAQTLKSGTQSLTDGIAQLADGASALAEGMGTFDEEGIQTLSRLVEDDAQGFFDRLRTLQDYAGEYTAFSGGVPGTPGTVKFIIRTDPIEKS